MTNAMSTGPGRPRSEIVIGHWSLVIVLPLVRLCAAAKREPHMSRVMCYRCFWPEPMCWCGSITPMPTRTRFVLLMHPHELKRVRANTGRLTHLCLADSVIHVGINFDEHEAVQE